MSKHSRKEKNHRHSGGNGMALKRPTLERPELRGLRYANLLRCSNISQADTSPEGQKQFNDAFAGFNGLRHVADQLAEGVSGSQTFNRKDIKNLLDLHRKTPFDVLLVYDLSRLTRGGIRHGNVVENDLRKAGIRVISTTDLIPDGPEGELIKSVKHYANQLQARTLSLATARGLAQSLARGDRPAASLAPFGLDRLYIGPGDEPRMLVRWDGLIQRWLNPRTMEQVGVQVRPETPRRRRKGEQSGGRRTTKFRGYIKQSDERSQFVPGSKERLDILVWMLTVHFIGRRGCHLITQDLNDRGILSPLGTKWCRRTVRKVLYNPIYLGIEVRNRWTGALYNKLGAEGPIPVIVDQDALEAEGRTSVPREERPRDEWVLADVPHLKNVLPSPLREIVAERIMAKLDPDAVPDPRKGVSLTHGEVAIHRHHNSPFVLTNLLHSAQSGYPMRGEAPQRQLKSGVRTYRYYYDGGSAAHGAKGLLIRRVQAEPVERAVLGALSEVLSAEPSQLAEMVQVQVGMQPQNEVPDAGRREALHEEREQITLRLRQAYRLGKAAAAVLGDELDEDAARLEKIDTELRRLDKVKHTATTPADADAVAERVVLRLAHLHRELDQLPYGEIKNVLAAMVDDLQIDLQTLEVRFALVLPSSLMTVADDVGDDEGGAAAVRLEGKPSWWSPSDANWTDAGIEALVLGFWTCRPTQSRGNADRRREQCYACTRTKRAA